MQSLQSSAPFRSHPEPLMPSEIDREARALWAQIAGETGSMRGQVKTVTRTYLLARDIQRAVADGGMRKTVLRIVRFFQWVIERSYGMQTERV